MVMVNCSYFWIILALSTEAATLGPPLRSVAGSCAHVPGTALMLARARVRGIKESHPPNIQYLFSD